MDSSCLDAGWQVGPRDRLPADGVAETGRRLETKLQPVAIRGVELQGLFQSLPGPVAVAVDPRQPQSAGLTHQRVIQVAERSLLLPLRLFQGGVELDIVQHSANEQS